MGQIIPGKTPGHIIPKKSLGQNFLIDKNIIKKIVDSLDAPDGARVIEIGPGTGALTLKLAEKNYRLTAVDLDQRAVAELNEMINPGLYPLTNILHADFLTMELSDFANDKSLYIIGNIPYYISGRIFYKLFETSHLIEEALIMVQKEVAHRICALPKTKDYGILTIAANLCGDAEILFDVSRTCFYPRPNVTSTVLKLRFNSSKPSAVDFNKFMALVKAAFNQRRKKLGNSIRKYLEQYNINTRQLSDDDSIISGFMGMRAEELTVDNYLELYRGIHI